jgi:hypothetical protein
LRSSATIYGTINHQDQLFRPRRRQSCDDQRIWFQNCTAKQNSSFGTCTGTKTTSVFPRSSDDCNHQDVAHEMQQILNGTRAKTAAENETSKEPMTTNTMELQEAFCIRAKALHHYCIYAIPIQDPTCSTASTSTSWHVQMRQRDHSCLEPGPAWRTKHCCRRSDFYSTAL